MHTQHRWRNAVPTLISRQWLPQPLLLASLVVLLPFRWTGISEYLPGCLLYELTGFYCPGCGATRACELLAHGNLAAALAMNALLPLIAVIAFLLICLPHGTLASICRSRAFALIAVGIVIGFTIARNLPWEPFRLLAPGAIFAR